MAIQQLKVGQLIVDETILPRALNYVHLSDMKNAALSGATFPPIIADRATKRIVSGLHRYNMFVGLYGGDYLMDVDLLDFGNDDEMFVAAVEANTDHGLPFTTFDRRRILVEAERRGISREIIAAAIKVPVEKADRKLATGSAFVKTAAGDRERVALRTSMKPLAGTNLTKAQVDANKTTSMKVQYYADSLTKLLRAGVLTWGNATAQAAIATLHKELMKRVTD